MIWVWWILVYGLALYGAVSLGRDIGDQIDKLSQPPLTVAEAFDRALRESCPYPYDVPAGRP